MTIKSAVERADFREAMARLGAAVNIITTRAHGDDSGLTVSAVCSVSDDPATLLVCINRASRQHDLFRDSGIVCVNVLASTQETLSGIFAGKDSLPMAERFARGRWSRLATGAAALDEATANLDCNITQMIEAGTHTVFFCGVQAIRLGSNKSCLVYHGRSYHAIKAAAPELQ